MDERQFFEAIAKNALKGAYFLHGAEEYSKQQGLRMALGFLDPALRDMNVSELTAPMAADVIAACEQLPFFAETRAVIVREPVTAESEKLIAYLDQLPKSTLLFVVVRGAQAKNTILYTGFHKRDRAVEFAPYDPGRAAAFVKKRAAERNVTFTGNSAARLVTMLGVGLAPLESAVMQAADYVGEGGQVTNELLDRLVTPSVEYKIFTMFDCMMTGRRAEGLTTLAGMLKSGESALGIASFLEGRMKLMLRAKYLLLAGKGEQAAVKELGGSPYAAKGMLQYAKKRDADWIENAVLLFASVDELQKTGGMRDTDALYRAVLTVFSEGKK